MSEATEKALVEALEAHVREEAETPGLLLTDWIVVAACGGWDDAGDGISALHIVPGGGAYYRMLGLLDEAATRTRADMIEDLRGD